MYLAMCLSLLIRLIDDSRFLSHVSSREQDLAYFVDHTLDRTSSRTPEFGICTSLRRFFSGVLCWSY